MYTKPLHRYLTVFSMLIFITASALQLDKEENKWYWRSQKTFEVKPSGTLKIRDIHGDVSVSSWDENRVEIKMVHHIEVYTENEAEAILENLEINLDATANTVMIVGTDIFNKSVYSDYEIQVPKQFNCDLHISGGDLSIEDIDGTITTHVGGGDVSLSQITGPLKLRLGGGDLEIEGCQKDMDIQVGGGDCEINEVGGKIDAKVGGGDVELTNSIGPIKLELGGGDLEIRDIQKDIQVKIGGGDVEIIDIQGNAKCTLGGGSLQIEDVLGALTAKSGGGDIDVALTDGKNFKSPIELENGMGEITLTLPSNIKATLHVEIDKLHDYSDEEIESDFPLRMSTKEDASEKNNWATGTINGGGPSIYLKTRGGDISIQKGDD